MSESTMEGAIAYVLSKYSLDEIDGVAFYCQELKRCYQVPISKIAGRSAIHPRLTPAASNQEAAINYAADYESLGL